MFWIIYKLIETVINLTKHLVKPVKLLYVKHEQIFNGL